LPLLLKDSLFDPTSNNLSPALQQAKPKSKNSKSKAIFIFFSKILHQAFNGAFYNDRETGIKETGLFQCFNAH